MSATVYYQRLKMEDQDTIATEIKEVIELLHHDIDNEDERNVKIHLDGTYESSLQGVQKQSL